MIGTLSITASMQGVGINTETHQVLFSDPTGTTLTTFSLLDETVSSIKFTVGQQGYVAAGSQLATRTWGLP